MTVSVDPPLEPTEPARGNGGVAPATLGRVPDFFIIGHEKCGTTALDLMLKGHPQIFMPEAKEQKFFVPELRGGLSNPRAHDAARPRTLEGYLALFSAAGPEQRAGEASPQYLRSHGAASRIAAVQPAARMIAILREPASFLRSFHLQWMRNGVETQRDFRKALALEPDRRQGRRLPRRCAVPETLFYSDHVRYVEQLNRYREVFPSEQLLVLIYDDFRRDNQATLRQVLQFLEVDDTIAIEPVETKSLRAVRSPFLQHLADSARQAGRNPAAAGRLGRTIHSLTPKPLRSERFRAKWRKVVYTAADAADEEFMRELRRRFKPEVIAISEYLGRDLVSEWGYDDVD